MCPLALLAGSTVGEAQESGTMANGLSVLHHNACCRSCAFAASNSVSLDSNGEINERAEPLGYLAQPTD